jgi:anti-sigma-K factor RskA
MSVPSLEELERQLSALPPEAWDRPVPPPPPWAMDGPGPAHALAGGPREAQSPGAAHPPARPARALRRRRRPLVLRPLRAALASVALLATGLGAGLLLAGRDDPAPGPAPGSLRVVLQPLGGQGAAGAVTLTGGAGGSATASLSGLPPSGRGEFYELWLLGDDGELVSLGSVRVPASGRAELRVEIPVDPGRFRYLDVSREPADGDPGHSSDSVLRGVTRQ